MEVIGGPIVGNPRSPNTPLGCEPARPDTRGCTQALDHYDLKTSYQAIAILCSDWSRVSNQTIWLVETTSCPERIRIIKEEMVRGNHWRIQLLFFKVSPSFGLDSIMGGGCWIVFIFDLILALVLVLFPFWSWSWVWRWSKTFGPCHRILSIQIWIVVVAFNC